jgi:hypothetical protein
MAELDGLFSRQADVGCVAGTLEGHDQADGTACQQEDDRNADESNRVRRTRKYLGHRSPVPLPALTPPAA